MKKNPKKYLLRFKLSPQSEWTTLIAFYSYSIRKKT
jgi:hypothetical protein